ncbi:MULTISPECIES: DUF397 domain-containing protein [Actinomadura]|uniref:DUF397 domain-containing protein n=1 Tax=Actinomadura yumaensis TaxID=111807 RepID=A0ABW2CEB1_9ACTN|nr:DUF397 domain-containing protein [Actinomadura sp. J1-007]MWK35544.1 DUF397 domain-containing protein [Actinomadura sp. J1-007]
MQQWRKSSYSSGQSSNADCVEIAGSAGRAVCVRDSKAPERGRLVLTAKTFAELVRRVKA